MYLRSIVTTNPDTPDANLELLRQYRAQNPDRFLSDEQMAKQRTQDPG